MNSIFYLIWSSRFCLNGEGRKKEGENFLILRSGSANSSHLQTIWSKFKKWITWNKHSWLLIYTSNRVLEPAQAGKQPIQRGMQDDNNSSSWAFQRARVLLLRAYLLGLLLCIILLHKILWKRKIVSIMISCKTVVT